MRSIRAVALLAVVVVAMMAIPAHAHSEVDMVGTLFVPLVQTAEVNHPTRFVNMEPVDFPNIRGFHNVAPDHDLGHLPGLLPFPATSPDLYPTSVPGRPHSWTWTPTAAMKGKVYAYLCDVHPWQRGIIVVQ